jgi:hypothetical protein
MPPVLGPRLPSKARFVVAHRRHSQGAFAVGEAQQRHLAPVQAIFDNDALACLT